MVLALLATAVGTARAQTAFLPTQLPRGGMNPLSTMPAAPQQIVVDADFYYGDSPAGSPCLTCPPYDGYGAVPGQWEWHLLPDGLIWHSYLAGPKEPRLGTQIFHEQDRGTLMDSTLGGRVSLLRFGTNDVAFPEGWELQVEGAAFPRINLDDEWDLESADFRAGVPLVYGLGKFQMKFAYYHLSSHLGDEMIVADPSLAATRINYSRDALVFGVSYFLNPSLRLYGEAGWAFYNSGGSQPWEFQFGFSYSPIDPTTIWGAPFLAANGQLREELDYGGTVVAEAGWQWRGKDSHLLRLGFFYLNGAASQYQFLGQHEEQIGGGLWYDY